MIILEWLLYVVVFVSHENVKKRTVVYKRLGLPAKQIYEVISRIYCIHALWLLSGLCFLSSRKP
jgi:hypothetical protein